MVKIYTKQNTGLQFLNDSKAFIEYSNDMDDIYENIQEYNPNKKQKILIVFDDMIADMLRNKKLNPLVNELFIRGSKLNIYFVFITQYHLAVPKHIRLNSTHYLAVKISNKRGLNHSSDIDFQDFIYKKCTAKQYYFLIIDTTLTSDNPLRFRTNHSERI